MPGNISTSINAQKPGYTGVIAIYLLLAAQVGRTVTDEGIQGRLPWYLGLMLAYMLLFTILMLRRNLPIPVLHSYFGIQTALTTILYVINPDMDFITAFFVPLSYQAALVFNNKVLWTWVGIFGIFIGGPLMLFHGVVQGIALALMPICGCIVLPAYIAVNREIEAAHIHSQVLLNTLEETHQRLQSYADQVEDLAAIEERNQLARKLHDSVSQLIFSITLTTRSAQLLLEKDPKRVLEELTHLQEMTKEALSRLRSLITQLRPSNQH